MRGLISYDFVHGLGRQSGSAVLAAFSRVLRQYAIDAAPARAGILLDLAADDDPVLDATYAQLWEQYGLDPSVQEGFHIDGTVFRAYRWTIPEDTIDLALAETVEWRSRQPILNRRLGVQIWWKFLWRDPLTGEKLPGQDSLPQLDFRRPGPSSLGLTLLDPPRVALWLLFPFGALDDTAVAYIRGFESALPTRLSRKHWRLWAPDKHGEWKPRKCNPLGGVF